MKKVVYIILIAIVGILIVLFLKGRHPANQSLDKQNLLSSKNPVILLIIDSLMDEPLQHAIKEGRAPALKFFLERGHYYPEIVSSYPTMSVSIDSTLLTGTYPDQHKVPGLVWYDEKEQRLVSYGSAREEILKLGVGQVIEDGFYHLNHTHLSRDTKTIHEELAMRGQHSGSINALVYRGSEKRTIKLPEALSLANMPTNFDIETPELFSYGAFAQFSQQNKENTQLWEAFGFNDKFSTEELKLLIEHNKLPAFTLVYYSDLDKEVHKNGPNHHVKGIEKVDQQLQKLLNSYESWDEAINNKVWILLGDSGQAVVKQDKREGLINLHTTLQSYQIHRITEPLKEDDQIVLALNERMAFIHKTDPNLELESIVEKLQKDERIGLIAWKGNDWIEVIKGGQEGWLSFQPKGSVQDTYNQSWTLEGDHSVLDLTVLQGKVEYGRYPDALARLYSSLHSHSGDYIVVDAEPGFEFVAEGTPTHSGGGSHGSIHEQDSLVPMIVTGTDTKPNYSRIIDLKPWILDLIQTER